MYLIYSVYYNSLATMREPSIGCEIIGYVPTKEEAEGIVTSGGNFPLDHILPECRGIPRYRYEEVSRLKESFL